MDVTLIGNYPHDENESMTRYAEMLKKLLLANGSRVEIIRPEPFFGRLKKSSHGIGKWLGYLDKYVLFPLSLRRHVHQRKNAGQTAGTFLVHICDHSNAVYTRWLQDVPHAVTCHDVMAILSARGKIPGISIGWTGRLLQGWILHELKNADYVMCDTPETRADLLALAPELDSRSSTLELPLNYPFAPMPQGDAMAQLSSLALKAFRPGQDRFLFHVGGNQWYKNREGVIRIYASLCSSHPDLIEKHSLKLILAGKPPTEAMLRLVEEKGLVEKVIFVTSVSDQQLCAFYSLAEVLVYPSLKEGFGWPIIEAQACRCPVVTSDRAPMNRLAGPASLLANPENDSDFSIRIFQILTEPPETRKYRQEEARRQAAHFDSQVFLKQMLATYSQIIKKKYFLPIK